MKKRLSVFCVLVAWWSAATVLTAADRTWIAAADGYWTNAANWDGVGYPGQFESDHVFLTNAVPTFYRVTLDTNPANTVPAIVMSNAVGEAWLQVTNCTYTRTAEWRLRQGARLRIGDATVSGVAGGSFDMAGTDTALILDENARLESSGHVFLFAQYASGNTGLVHALTETHGAWNLANARIEIGDNGTNNHLRVDNARLENLYVFVGQNGGISNTLVVANGARIVGGTSSSIRSGTGAGSTGNGILVTGENTLFDFHGRWCYIGGSAGQNHTGNWFRVEQGAVVTNSLASQLEIRVAAANNSVDQRFEIVQGGRCYAGRFDVGTSTGRNNNLLLIEGAGSLLDTLGWNINVGHATAATGNTLRIAAGGAVANVGTVTIHTNNVLDFSDGLLAAANMSYRESLYTLGSGCVFRGLGGTWDFHNGLALDDGSILEGAGTFDGRDAGVTARDGALLRPGTEGPGDYSVPNLRWEGGAVYVCRVRDLAGSPGSGWSHLSVSQLDLADDGKDFVIALDSMGADVAHFATNANYRLRILEATDMDGYDPARFVLDTDALHLAEEPAVAWTLTNINNSLYLSYEGSPESYPPADAAWDPERSGYWSVADNWLAGVAPVSDSDLVLEFGAGDSPYVSTNDHVEPFSLHRLMLSGDTEVTNVLRGAPLEIRGQEGGIVKTGFGTTYRIENPIVIEEDLHWTGWGAGGDVAMTGPISGAGGLIKEGAWNLILGASNSFAGPVVMNSPAAWLRADSVHALGTNSLSVSNGTLRVAAPYVFSGSAGLRSAWLTGGGAHWDMGAHALTFGPNVSAVITNHAQLTAGSLMLQGGGMLSQLRVTHGGRMTTSAESFVGLNTSNAVLLAGTDSTWDLNLQDLWIGKAEETRGAVNNTVALGVGSSLARIGELHIGRGAGSEGNMLVNAGSLVARVISVGADGGIGNGLATIEGGKITTPNQIHRIGAGVGSRDNFALVTDAGSEWKLTSGSDRIYIGDDHASNNWLRVEHGGFVECGWHNMARVGGAFARNNRLIVADGGMAAVRESGMWVGASDGAVSNGLWIVGQDSHLSLAGSLLVGNAYGTGNWVRVENDGRASGVSTLAAGRERGNVGNSIAVETGGRLLSSGIAHVGGGGECVSNRIEISGSATLWTHNGAFRVAGGHDPSVGHNVGNRLAILDGAEAGSVTTIHIGFGPNDVSNSVEVVNGGALHSTGETVVGNHSNAHDNSFVVRGADSLWHAGQAHVRIGLDALATGNELVIDQGGTVAAVGTLTVASNNVATLAGGTLELAHAQVQNGQPFAVGDGNQPANLVMLGETAAFSDGLVVSSNAWLTGSGTVAADTTVYGTLAPGRAGPGAVVHSGSLDFMAGSTSRFELAAHSEPGIGWDSLTVSAGTATLGGTLRVVLTDGFVPSPEQSFLIVAREEPASLAGAYDNVVGNTVEVYVEEDAPPVARFRVSIASQGLVLDQYGISDYAIVASAGTGGTITPSGSVSVAPGASTSFVVAASSYYDIHSIETNHGQFVSGPFGPVYTSTWSNVGGTGYIAAVFSPRLAPLGTPEWWLAQFEDWTNNFAMWESLDWDGDGRETWQEYLASTDPTDSNSTFVIHSAGNDRGTNWLKWTSVYVDPALPPFAVEQTTNLNEGLWEPASPATVSRSEGTNVWRSSESVPNHPPVFYRIVATP